MSFSRTPSGIKSAAGGEEREIPLCNKIVLIRFRTTIRAVALVIEATTIIDKRKEIIMS